jgi:phage terminase large subunit-like protein
MGVGGAATGKGADILIIDDPIKNRKEAESQLIKRNIYKWYQSTARTRLSPSGAVIVMVTRWADDDLVGMILQGENAKDWEIISLPAIADEDEQYRKKGEALWEGQYNLENLLKTKGDIGLYEFSSLYQQNPINSETQEFKKEMFKYITQPEVRNKRTTCWVTIDPAVKEHDMADYTGTVINRVDEENNWYIKANRKRINSTKLIDHVFDLWDIEHPDAIGIEETTYYDAVYPFLKLEMVKRNIYPIIYPLKHHGVKKELRIRGLLPRYEAGKIFHIIGECDTLEEEQLRFPKGMNDDQVDAEAYQEQIVVAPDKEKTQLQQAIEDMQIDERTGYFK